MNFPRFWTAPTEFGPPGRAERGGLRLTRIQLVFCGLLLAAVLILDLPPLFEAQAIILAASMFAVIVSVPLVMRLAFFLNAVDRPDARRIHREPTPRLGGPAVGFGVLFALFLASMRYMPNLRALFLGSFLMMAVGVADDIRPVKAWIKLLFQLAACAIVIADGIHITFLPPVGWGVPGRWLITAFWIVGITNAVNFLDGMDGLLASLVMGTGLIYLLLSLALGSNMLGYCSVALFGAAFGFLGYNIKPARIFLGDGGSTFLGFFLAVLSVQGSWARNNPLVSFFIPILVLSVPIFDMVFTTCARIASGRVRSFREWIEYAGKDHLHHRLEALGLTRGQVVLTIAFLNVAVGLGAVVLIDAGTLGGIVLLVQAACVYAVIALLDILGRRKG